MEGDKSLPQSYDPDLNPANMLVDSATVSQTPLDLGLVLHPVCSGKCYLVSISPAHWKFLQISFLDNITPQDTRLDFSPNVVFHS